MCNGPQLILRWRRLCVAVQTSSATRVLRLEPSLLGIRTHSVLVVVSFSVHTTTRIDSVSLRRVFRKPLDDARGTVGAGPSGTPRDAPRRSLAAETGKRHGRTQRPGAESRLVLAAVKLPARGIRRRLHAFARVFFIVAQTRIASRRIRVVHAGARPDRGPEPAGKGKPPRPGTRLDVVVAVFEKRPRIIVSRRETSEI